MAKSSLQKFDIFNMIRDSFLIEKSLNRVPCVPCGPAWSTCLLANVPTCQKSTNISFLRAKVPMCQ